MFEKFKALKWRWKLAIAFVLADALLYVVAKWIGEAGGESVVPTLIVAPLALWKWAHLPLLAAGKAMGANGPFWFGWLGTSFLLGNISGGVSDLDQTAREAQKRP